VKGVESQQRLRRFRWGRDPRLNFERRGGVLEEVKEWEAEEKRGSLVLL